jgi:hypothetical protein
MQGCLQEFRYKTEVLCVRIVDRISIIENCMYYTIMIYYYNKNKKFVNKRESDYSRVTLTKCKIL